MLLSQKYGKNLPVNYSPFGTALYGRNWSSEKYRYGFQGQERDDEIKGKGNSVNYTFRMHDPRLGRFFAVDPLSPKYPHYSPYMFSGNKVIAFVELEGLEEVSYTENNAGRGTKNVTVITQLDDSGNRVNFQLKDRTEEEKTMPAVAHRNGVTTYESIPTEALNVIRNIPPVSTLGSLAGSPKEGRVSPEGGNILTIHRAVVVRGTTFAVAPTTSGSKISADRVIPMIGTYQEEINARAANEVFFEINIYYSNDKAKRDFSSDINRYFRRNYPLVKVNEEVVKDKSEVAVVHMTLFIMRPTP